jgi:hypothetical protein
VLVTGIEVEPIGVGEYFGFEIDGDHLFMLGDFTVTHNTTLAVHAVSSAVKACAELWEANGKVGRKPMVVLFFTEGSKDVYRCRLLSHMATVPWKRLSQMQALGELSDSSAPGASPETAYELTEFPTKNSGFVSERGRVQTAARDANEHLILIDGSDREAGGIGAGGAPEFVAKLGAYQVKHPDQYFYSVWVDHLSAWARRALTAHGKDPKDNLRHELLAMVQICGDHIAGRLQTPVALLHQFSGQANKKGPGARFHHSDAAECAAVAEYVDFAVNTGPTDHQLLCNWSCTKHRREPPVTNRIVKVRGQFNTLLDKAHLFYLDEGQKMIVSRAEVDSAEANARMTDQSYEPNPTEVIS